MPETNCKAVKHFFKIEFGENKQDEVKFEYNYEALERMFNSSPAEKKLRHVRDWLKRPPKNTTFSVAVLCVHTKACPKLTAKHMIQINQHCFYFFYKYFPFLYLYFD
jgi:hypothetical protein